MPAETHAASLVRLRLARTDDIPHLRQWDKEPHVQASFGTDDGDFEWETEVGREVDWREILIAEIGDRPIGVVCIIDPAREESHYWGVDVAPNLKAIDIWIGSTSDLGKGYGTAMMKTALDRCFADPSVVAVIIDPLESNTAARRYYERIGFREVERRVFERELCVVYRYDRPAA